MIRRQIILFTVMIIVILFGVSCSENLLNGDSLNEETLINTSEGGALLITGTAIDENREINLPETTFTVNEDFYFYFHNNEPFGTDRITVRLIDSINEKVLAESDYDVQPETAAITDMVWFGAPGKFKIAVIVDGQVRAIREVLIE